MIKCPKCGTVATTDPVECPLCGFKLYQVNRRWVGYIILGAIILVLILILVSGDSYNTAPADDRITAKVMAEKFVLDKLVSPATAKFSNESETEIERTSDGAWTVAGWVDSQNVYSALIRNRYRVTLKAVGNKNWHASEVLVTAP